VWMRCLGTNPLMTGEYEAFVEKQLIRECLCGGERPSSVPLACKHYK
jgi:hypothetical protein